MTLDYLPVPDLIEQTGATYRQLDYWVRTGRLRPDAVAGSGHLRVWPEREIAVARLMVRLLDAGMSLAIAGDAARQIVESGSTSVELARGVFLDVEVNS